MAVAMAVAVVASSTASAQPHMAWCNGSIGRAVPVAPVLSLVNVSLAKRRHQWQWHLPLLLLSLLLPLLLPLLLLLLLLLSLLLLCCWR